MTDHMNGASPVSARRLEVPGGVCDRLHELRSIAVMMRPPSRVSTHLALSIVRMAGPISLI